jgi:hypothetical protein
VAISETEKTLRRDLLKLKVEHSGLKAKDAEHERVHRLCSNAINELTEKNSALTALAHQLKRALTASIKAYAEATEMADVASLPSEEPWLQQMADDALAECEALGIEDVVEPS